MKSRIETLPEKKLIGKRIKMPLSNDKTRELWQDFMPEKKTIQNCCGTLLYSLQVYDPMYFNNFNPDKEFEKWAAIEVTDFETVSIGMETITIPSGLYVVFSYRGSSNNGPEIFRYIFETWLPDSKYELDNRPHFEVLGEKYRNNDPDSEEEIWIPVRQKRIIIVYLSYKLIIERC